ncbi:hypothetical protein F0562_024021 [Nyssa sinensis]|uniref:Uncharacterized protein n=1 Tax=Nyssa sinensis TaxID=561372 RepID=A0A5J5BJB2_9ASTE|nr:hypothetical protein F0562_024021 [Nyssa sinensis]
MKFTTVKLALTFGVAIEDLSHHDPSKVLDRAANTHKMSERPRSYDREGDGAAKGLGLVMADETIVNGVASEAVDRTRLCETLLDVEEWGQIVLVGILLRYVIVRHGLVRESILLTSCSTESYHSEKDGPKTNFELKENIDDMGGGIFADDLGLVKTLTLLSLIAFDKYSSSIDSSNHIGGVNVDKAEEEDEGDERFVVRFWNTARLFRSLCQIVPLAKVSRFSRIRNRGVRGTILKTD